MTLNISIYQPTYMYLGITLEHVLNHGQKECLQIYWNGFHCGQDADIFNSSFDH